MVSFVFVTECWLKEVVVWSDPCASWDVANFGLLVFKLSFLDVEVAKAFVLELSKRLRHQKSVTNLQCLEVLSHQSTIREVRVFILAIELNDKVDRASLENIWDWRVLASNDFTVYIRLESYMLTYGDSKCLSRVCKLEYAWVSSDISLAAQNETYVTILILLVNL